MKIQNVFLNELQCYIATECGKVMQRGYFNDDFVEFGIGTSTSPSNIKKSIF